MFKFRYFIVLFFSPSLFAVTILHVTMGSDNNAGGIGDPGDLRYCLNSMNQQLNTTPDDYEIVFDFPMTIQLNGILPIINTSATPVNITIGNSGSIPTVTIDGGGVYSGFFIPMGNVTIQNMIFQNLVAQGGDGGDGISGGGGGMGAGGAIYAPQSFLNGSDPSITLINVSINSCSAIGGNGGNYIGGSATGDEGGGGGGDGTQSGGGGGGSRGFPGTLPQGNTPPGASAVPSGGNGGDGGGGGGGGVVTTNSTNSIDGGAGSGGYAGGGGGGAGTGAYDTAYTVRGGSGGVGGGGGGGGVNQSGFTPAEGGNSGGGGGGAGAGPSDGFSAAGGTDTGFLGGGAGGAGAATYGAGFGGGGGGGSGLGGAIFVDSGLNLTIQAFSGIPTTFNTSTNTTQAGIGGTAGSGGGFNGTDGSALGDSIFLRQGSSLSLISNDVNDLLTLGDQVAFTDDTTFGGGGTSVFVTGNGTVIYNGRTDYPGTITVNNANFKVNGLIDTAAVSVCRNIGLSDQRGTLSGTGTLTGSVSVNSGTVSPDTGGTLTLGSLILNSPAFGALGSLVHIEIDSGGTSLVDVTGAATLAGVLEIDLDPSAVPGTYAILTSAGITGTFDSVTFTGTTPNYSLSYLPEGSPTFVQFDFLGYTPSIEPASNFQGKQKKNVFLLQYDLYNQLTWTLSPSPETTGYYLSRDGDQIATLSASTRSYQDHNRPRGVSSLYSLVAFDGNGNMSSPVTVTVGR